MTEDEQFWFDLDAELEAYDRQTQDYVNSLSEEEFYRQFVLPYQQEEGEELLYEPSIAVI
ncbi:hypothetical protein SCRM01_242 [Synechococcus phage S-CRM01]|uniref:hypothetical protein n=1 Tax=Synechococcus phage S-CRM01 TaxID=1026955 RepID=UPI000209E443|nr:hypothetical protein SCRM01_242 [Synechococcus phage S-CRM01]AEC53188.1 hypothetical protein SCRM01_242 [Synechococcus phage S-CRM01]